MTKKKPSKRPKIKKYEPPRKEHCWCAAYCNEDLQTTGRYCKLELYPEIYAVSPEVFKGTAR